MTIFIEVLLFVGALILVIMGSALIMIAWDLLWWVIKQVTGIRIHNGNDSEL